jgi:hypothetical protein
MLKDIRPSPVKNLYHTKVELNPIDHQYSVTPAADFASLAEAEFIEKGTAAVKIRAPQAIVLRPPKELLERVMQSEDAAGAGAKRRANISTHI